MKEDAEDELDASLTRLKVAQERVLHRLDVLEGVVVKAIEFHAEYCECRLTWCPLGMAIAELVNDRS